MSTRAYLANMKKLIEDAKAKGVEAIGCDNLIRYLDELLKSRLVEPGPLVVEEAKAFLQRANEDAKHAQATQLEQFRSVITYGQNAIKTLLLINGGAAVALLAFIAHLAQHNPAKVPTFAGCLLPFTVGVLVTGVTSAAAYASQWFFGRQPRWCVRTGWVLNIACMVLGVASLAAFAWGLCRAWFAFTTYS